VVDFTSRPAIFTPPLLGDVIYRRPLQIMSLCSRCFDLPIVPGREEEEAEGVARGHHVHGLRPHGLRAQGGFRFTQ